MLWLERRNVLIGSNDQLKTSVTLNVAIATLPNHNVSVSVDNGGPQPSSQKAGAGSNFDKEPQRIFQDIPPYAPPQLADTAEVTDFMDMPAPANVAEAFAQANPPAPPPLGPEQCAAHRQWRCKRCRGLK
jgi:hypothetical protein